MVKVKWDDSDGSNEGWYVQVLNKDVTGAYYLVTDSMKHDFPVDVDRFKDYQHLELEKALQREFPGEEIVFCTNL